MKKNSSGSEVICTTLRLLKMEVEKKKDLNKALMQGEKSGFEKNFNANTHLKKLHSQFPTEI